MKSLGPSGHKALLHLLAWIPPILRSFCNQAMLAFNTKCSGASLPDAIPPDWGAWCRGQNSHSCGRNYVINCFPVCGFAHLEGMESVVLQMCLSCCLVASSLSSDVNILFVRFQSLWMVVQQLLVQFWYFCCWGRFKSFYSVILTSSPSI